MKELRIPINFLFIALSLSGMAYAMEGEKKEVLKEQEFISELFAELPLELQQEIIISAAKIGKLQETVENIRNLALVSKEFNKLINSKQTTNAILNGLIENENIQNFFNQLVGVIQSAQTYSMVPADLELLKMYITNKDKKKLLLLALLGTRQAQEVFKQATKTDVEKEEMNKILGALSSVSAIVKDRKIPLEKPLEDSLIYMILRLAQAFSILEIAFPSGIGAILQNLIEYYPEHYNTVPQDSILFQYSKDTKKYPPWFTRMYVQKSR